MDRPLPSSIGQSLTVAGILHRLLQEPLWDLVEVELFILAALKADTSRRIKMDWDAERCGLLLDIVHKAQGIPQLKPILEAANVELGLIAIAIQDALKKAEARDTSVPRKEAKDA